MAMKLEHECEGLKEFYAAVTYQCIPTIGNNGIVHGCDDSNQVPIKFCPFCGERLALAERTPESQK